MHLLRLSRYQTMDKFIKDSQYSRKVSIKTKIAMIYMSGIYRRKMPALAAEARAARRGS